MARVTCSMSKGTRFEYQSNEWTVRHIATKSRTPLAILVSDEGELLELPLSVAMHAAHEYFSPDHVRDVVPGDVLSDCTPEQRARAEERATYMRLILDGAPAVSFGSGPGDRYHPDVTNPSRRRSQLISDLKGVPGYSRASIYRMLRCYEPERNIRELVPYKATDQAPDPRLGIPAEYLDAVYRGLAELAGPHHAKRKLEVRVVRAITAIRDAQLDPDLIPPYRLERAVARASKELGLTKASRQRKNEASRAITGHRTQPPVMPGERIEIDATQADIWLICPESRERFRPWVVVLICVVTRLVAVRVTREPPVAADWRLALFSALHPLVSEQPKYDIDIPFGVPSTVQFRVAPYGFGTIVNDHGSNIENYQMSDCVARWGGEIEYAATRTGSHKPYVENANSVINMFLQYTDTYSGGSVDNKADVEALPDSDFLTIEQFRAILTVWANKIRPYRPHEGLPTSNGDFHCPASRFAQCVARGLGPRIDVHPDDIYGLLDSTELKINPEGIHKGPFRYHAEIVGKIVNDIRKSRGLIPETIRVHHDRNDLSRVFIRDSADGCWYALRAIADDGTALEPFSSLISEDWASELGDKLWTRGQRFAVGVLFSDLLSEIRKENSTRFSKDRARVALRLPDPTGRPGSSPVGDVDNQRPDEDFPFDIEEFVIRDVPDIGDDLW